MDIVQLKYFKAVAETGHLTNAAKQLNVAQPALSVSISRLENELGVPLFDRQGRRIALNSYGKMYLSYVEQALAILEHGQSEIQAQSEKNENVLNLGLVSKLFSQMVLIGFKELYPDSRIRSYDIMEDGIDEELLKGDVDYVLASRLRQNPEIVGEEIFRERYLLAVPSDSIYASCKEISLKDIRGEEFISLPKGYEHRIITDGLCEKYGFAPNVTTECFHCHMAGLVASGAGVAFMTESQAEKNRANKQLSFIPFAEADCIRHYYILWKADRHFNKVAEGFRNYVRNYYQARGMQDPCICEPH